MILLSAWCPHRHNCRGLLGDLRNVKESILVLVLLVDGAHKRGSRREHLVDEDEDGLLGRELDALANDVHELADGEVGRHEVLLLVDGRDVRLLNLLADHLFAALSVYRLFGRLARRTMRVRCYSFFATAAAIAEYRGVYIPGCDPHTSA